MKKPTTVSYNVSDLKQKNSFRVRDRNKRRKHYPLPILTVFAIDKYEVDECKTYKNDSFFSFSAKLPEIINPLLIVILHL